MTRCGFDIHDIVAKAETGLDGPTGQKSNRICHDLMAAAVAIARRTSIETDNVGDFLR